MVSSIYALTKPDVMVAANLSISTQAEVQSVRLFSRVPFDEIRTIAWDSSSMTSNALSQILLHERFGIKPDGVSLPPVQGRMLQECDACVMIGDAGMAGHSEQLYVMDLGAEWRALTGLPFVWALWVGRRGLSPSLVSRLQWSHETALLTLDRVVEEAALETGFSPSQCRFYFDHIMDYRLGPQHLAGLRAFGERLVGLGLVERLYKLRIVEAEEPALLR